MNNAYARKRTKSSAPAPDDTPDGVEDPPSLDGVALSSKSLTKREQERVRAALRELQARHPTQADLARALPLRVGQQTISKALREGAIGIKLAQSVAKARGQPLEDLLAGAPAARLYSDLPGWADAAREAAEHGEASAAIVAVGRWPASMALLRAEWRFVADLAALWRRWAPADERTEEETADAAREAEPPAPVRTLTTAPPRRGQTKS